jgi:hypothetical protein
LAVDFSNFTFSNISIPTPIGTIHLQLGNLSMAGLNTFSEFNMLRAVSDYSLGSEIILDNLDFNFTMDVGFTTVHPSNAGAIEEDLLREARRFWAPVAEMFTADFGVQGNLSSTVTLGIYPEFDNFL